MLTEDSEKQAAWKEIWHLTQRDPATGSYLYRTEMPLALRNDYINLFYDFLDYKRSVEIGDRYTDGNREPENRPVETPVLPIVLDPYYDTVGLRSAVHDPTYYSFNKNLKWIPWAEDTQSGAKRGRYAKGYPTGLVVHFTAGWRNGLKEGNALMRNTGMLYLLGDKDGGLAQSDSLESHGYHAGQSSHTYASGYVSDEYAGLELQSAGQLTEKSDGFYSWFKAKIADAEVVIANKKRNNVIAGAYHAYTPAQIDLLRRVACWLYLNNPEVFSPNRVVGHDEVSPGRKNDPGASILIDQIEDVDKEDGWLDMVQFRSLLWNDIDKINEERKRLGL